MERLVADVRPWLVEGHVVGRRRPRSVSIGQAQSQFDRNRGSAEQASDLNLGHRLVRHEIDKAKTQRTAAPGPDLVAVQDLDALCQKQLAGRQPRRKSDGHRLVPGILEGGAGRGSRRTPSGWKGQAAAATTLDAASPWSRSARMSSICSMPTDRRT